MNKNVFLTAQADIFDKLPIWTFHEVDDPTVPVHYTRDLVEAIHAAGGTRIKYTEYPASLGRRNATVRIGLYLLGNASRIPA